MNKFEAIEKAGNPIDKSIEFLEKFDRFKKSYTPILNGINWFLGLSTGILIWFLNDLNKFKIDNSSTSKYIILIIVISFGISTLYFASIRFMLLLREIAMNSAIDSLQSLHGKLILKNEKLDEKETKEKLEKKIDGYITLWTKGHNLIVDSIPFLKEGFILFVFGLMLMAFHIIRYIIVE